MESKNSILFKKKPLKSIDIYKRKQKQKEWKENRMQKFTSTRSLDLSTTSEIETPLCNITNVNIDESSSTEKLSRYQRLLKWKAEKEQRLQQQKKQVKAPVFKLNLPKPDKNVPGTSFNRSQTATPLSRPKAPQLAKSMLATTTSKKPATPNTSLKSSSSVLRNTLRRFKPSTPAATAALAPPSTHKKASSTPLSTQKSSFMTALRPRPVSKIHTEKKKTKAAEDSPVATNSKEGSMLYHLSHAKKTPVPRMLATSQKATPLNRLLLKPRTLDPKFPITSPTARLKEDKTPISPLARPITAPSFAPANFTFTAPSPLQKTRFIDMVQNFLKTAPVFKHSKKGLEVNSMVADS